AYRNFKKWPIDLCNQAEVFEENNDVTGNYSIDKSKYEDFLKKNKHLIKSTEGKAKSYKEELELMKNFIKNRGNWMDKNIDSLSKWAN
ncbi:MAG: spore coat protein CotH, partial [Clostridiales bacterium]|nr:spore coat protein CotH [Clostridiales bacterium]